MNPPDRPVWREPKAIALLMAATLTTMANATISPALPGLRAAFAADPSAEFLTRLLVPAPAVGVILCAPFAGIAADRIGRRPLLLAGIALFAVAGSAGLALPDLWTILASRLILGVAVALIMTAQTAMIGDNFVGPRRQALTGLQISARNFGGLVFILMAGQLAALSPRLPFGIYAIAALYLPYIWRVLPEAHRTPPPAAALSERAEARGWVVAFAALAGLQMLTNLVFFIVPTQLPFFMERLGFDGARDTGLALATLMLSGGLVALAFGRIQRAVGHAGAYALGFGAMGLGFLGLAAAAGIGVFAAVVAIGAGYAAVMPNFVALTLRTAPARRAGIAGGVLTTSVFLGQFASPFVSSPLIGAFGYPSAFAWIAAALAPLSFVAAAVGLFGMRRDGVRPMRLRESSARLP